MKIHSFTNEFSGLSHVLTSEIEILPHKSHTTSIRSNAIWDTGATGSVITKYYANKLGLIPVGKTQVKGVNNTKLVNWYLIDVKVHPEVLITQIRATEADDLAGGNNVAMLIGMDIISLGDFAVTNHNGKTTMSFRVPSIEKIDFNTQRSTVTPIRAIDGPRRNDPCPCRSGKKYKLCHGKGK